MGSSTKGKLQQALMTAAMTIPPWNIFWWLVGGIVYTVSGGRKWDTSGDGAIGLVLAAPVTLPAMPFMWAKEKLEERRQRKLEARIREAAEWIAVRLRCYGICVPVADADSFGMKLVAEVDHDQVPGYQSTMAEAVRQFPDILPEAFNGYGVKPLDHLDRTWAAKHGIGDHAEEHFTGPCADCGKDESVGWTFGRELIEFRRQYLARQHHEIHLKDGTTRTVDGHICRDCLDKMGWASMSSGVR